jgi:hypothetical protein
MVNRYDQGCLGSAGDVPISDRLVWARGGDGLVMRAMARGWRLGVVWEAKPSDLIEIPVLCNRLGQKRWPSCSVSLIVAATVFPLFSRHQRDDNSRIEMMPVELR